MKTLAIQVGLSILAFLLKNEAIHNEIRSLALKTENKFDDAAAESAIQLFKNVAGLLEK